MILWYLECLIFYKTPHERIRAAARGGGVNLQTLADNYTEFVSNAIKFGVYNDPTLFMKGSKSNYILPQDDFLIKQFPNSKIIKIPNVLIGCKLTIHRISVRSLKNF